MPRHRIQRIGVLTGGGDCPGLNAAIRAVVRTAYTECQAEVLGILDGFKGLLEARTVELSYDSVANILTLGGTILGTSRENPFKAKNGNNSSKPNSKPPKAGKTGKGAGAPADRSALAVHNFRRLKLDALICIGGDGTHRKANKLAQLGIPIIGIPKTIDHDLRETDATIGFDSSLAVATESIDRLHSTAASHHRIMVIEVMGNRAGWLALSAGMAGGGDVILIPEIRYRPQAVSQFLDQRMRRGRRFSIVVVAEGTRPRELAAADKNAEYAGDPIGRVGTTVARQIHEATGLETRVTVLGYVQRGGHPTAFDRLLATRFGAKAVELAAAGRFGRSVCLKGDQVRSVDLHKVAGPPFLVPPDHPLIESARLVGTCFGE